MDEVSICNLALSRVGVTIAIERLDQTRSKEAEVLSRVYETTRDKILGEAPWPFAKRYEPLNLSGDTPPTWKYRYVYPPECVAVRRVFPVYPGEDPVTTRRRLAISQYSYEIVGSEDEESTICTDVESAVAEFTARIVNPARYDAAFVSALAWALAAEIATPLARGIEAMKNAKVMLDLEISEACAKALKEEKRDPPPESEFVRARW